MLQLRTPRAAYRTNGRLSRLTTTPTRSTSSRFGGSGRIGVVGRTQRRVRILVPVQVTEARTTRPTRSADGASPAGLGCTRDARGETLECRAVGRTLAWFRSTGTAQCRRRRRRQASTTPDEQRTQRRRRAGGAAPDTGEGNEHDPPALNSTTCTEPSSFECRVARRVERFGPDDMERGSGGVVTTASERSDVRRGEGDEPQRPPSSRVRRVADFAKWATQAAEAASADAAAASSSTTAGARRRYCVPHHCVLRRLRHRRLRAPSPRC